MQEFYKNENTVDELNKMLAGTARVVWGLPKEYFPNLEAEEEFER